ncbi:hypothetical protein H112_05354 [Trichophyton rubrum D6]|uniref:Uncharacterized protein n=3 Tax=Trichophyton TaxID=5550 RepID=A0A080WLS6_TRIRC|nr:uncharacterized protein TERG_11948 [Trichophyton rubrum CBS 118892]EZF19046.1 hypothetical protein H100_05373 [Trichophyton rubrum MR850]EZF40710.1 hypothetical protein H102_05338 [Trichophyton rubrum CBS 100081]EZF51340.1 hypothetical protein H103_05363 [Trichophyton rubrum CBS 288.86]EZF61927.1 hypothetical protein H104_05354 [Trichophyton rubrum CBS 289.86]EZF72561.1 hypothetical protein H105_05381 [Trichophyton soudanense CBS 452.61]EZF83246.1 hypothetical protein H110_05360 [Trichophy
MCGESIFLVAQVPSSLFLVNQSNLIFPAFPAWIMNFFLTMILSHCRSACVNADLSRECSSLFPPASGVTKNRCLIQVLFDLDRSVDRWIWLHACRTSWSGKADVRESCSILEMAKNVVL